MACGAGVPAHQLEYRLLAGVYWSRRSIELRRADLIAVALAKALRESGRG